MVTRKGKKVSGGKYIRMRKKKAYEKPGQKRIVKLGNEKRKSQKTRGGNIKTVLFASKTINVRNKQGKIQKTEIKKVIETPSNRFLARQNILTKGTIIETELGKVKITNRPSQEGSVNGVLID